MTTHASLLPTYERFRRAGFNLNNKLVSTLSKEALDEGGRRLGILRQGILVFGSPEESAVLMDYCIYNVYTNGRNAVQRYLEESPPPAGSDEMTFLQAELKAYYSLVQVLSVERGVGVTVRDVLRGNTDFLIDISFGNTLHKDLLVAGRLVPLHGCLTTGGASLPVVGAAGEKIARGLERMDGATDFTRLTPGEEADLAAMMIRSCLEAGTSQNIVYRTPGEAPSRREGLRSGAPSQFMHGTSGQTPSRPELTSSGRERVRANRNDPCPCGSGRKYKSCCGKR
jgi:hypothetical protein